MNFHPLLANLKKGFGDFNPDHVTSMLFELRPFKDNYAMYATVTLTNGRTHEGWASEMSKDASTKPAKPTASPQAVEQGKAENETGLPLSELQPEGVKLGESVGSKDGDVFPEGIDGPAGNTGRDSTSTSTGPIGSTTTETAYPTGQSIQPVPSVAQGAKKVK